MAISQEIIQHFFEKAQEEKDAIKSIYNEVLELTDPFAKIDDAGKQTLGELRDIDSTVIDTIDAFRSFIMSSVLPRQGEWATITIDEERIIDEMGEGMQQQIDEVKKVIDDNTKKVFRYLQSANYYKEVSKSIESFIKVGTGAFSIRETGSMTKPFMFSYIGLDNLYFLEDALSRPNIVFKLHPEVNGSYMIDYFGRDVKLPSEVSDADPGQSISVYEVVIPEYDEQTTLTRYHYMVCSEDFGTIYLEKELSYCPIIIVRYDIIEGNCWGKSSVLALKNLLVELNNYKELYITQARRIANPPAAFAGNMELFDYLSLEEGTLNYLGDPMKENVQGQFQVLNTNTQLMPLDKLITEHRQIFRQALMVDDIVGASMQDGKGTTASYVNYRAEMFRKRFANTYELINSELLEPLFMSCVNIMMRYNMLTITEELLPFTQLQYVNALSNANNEGDVMKLMNYTQTIAQLNQANSQLGVAIDLPKATVWTAEKLAINLDLIPSESDLRQIMEAQRQQAMQQEQAMVQQAMAEQQAQGVM